jgi:hypothetical protein
MPPWFPNDLGTSSEGLNDHRNTETYGQDHPRMVIAATSSQAAFTPINHFHFYGRDAGLISNDARPRGGLSLFANAVAFAKPTSGRGTRNDVNDRLRHFALTICCGAQWRTIVIRPRHAAGGH